jgi:predicted  nucleic acid-binding Zn-ribbon protein
MKRIANIQERQTSSSDPFDRYMRVPSSGPVQREVVPPQKRKTSRARKVDVTSGYEQRNPVVVEEIEVEEEVELNGEIQKPLIKKLAAPSLESMLGMTNYDVAISNQRKLEEKQRATNIQEQKPTPQKESSERVVSGYLEQRPVSQGNSSGEQKKHTNKTIADLQSQIHELQIQLKSARNNIALPDNERSQQVLKKIQVDHQQAINELKQKISELNDEKQLIEQQKIDLTKNFDDERNQINDNHKVETVLLNAKLRKAEQNHKILDMEAQKLRNEIESITKKLDEANANVDGLKDQLVKMKDVKKTLKNQCKTTDVVCNEQAETIASLNVRIDGLEKQVKRAEENRDVELKNAQKARDELVEIQRQLTRQTDEIDDLKSQLDKQEKLVDEKQKFIDQLVLEHQSQLKNRDDRILSMDQDLKQASDDVDELTRQVQELRVNLADYERTGQQKVDWEDETGIDANELMNDIKQRASSFVVVSSTSSVSSEESKILNFLRDPQNFPTETVQWYTKRFLKSLHAKVTRGIDKFGEECVVDGVKQTTEDQKKKTDQIKCTEDILKRYYDMYKEGLDRILYAPSVVVWCIFWTDQKNSWVNGWPVDKNYDFGVESMVNRLNNYTSTNEEWSSNNVLANDNGSLKKNTVYVFHGISTDPQLVPSDQNAVVSHIDKILKENAGPRNITGDSMIMYAFFHKIDRLEAISSGAPKDSFHAWVSKEREWTAAKKNNSLVPFEREPEFIKSQLYNTYN